MGITDSVHRCMYDTGRPRCIINVLRAYLLPTYSGYNLFEVNASKYSLHVHTYLCKAGSLDLQGGRLIVNVNSRLQQWSQRPTVTDSQL